MLADIGAARLDAAAPARPRRQRRHPRAAHDRRRRRHGAGGHAARSRTRTRRFWSSARSSRSSSISCTRTRAAPCWSRSRPPTTPPGGPDAPVAGRRRAAGDAARGADPRAGPSRRGRPAAPRRGRRHRHRLPAAVGGGQRRARTRRSRCIRRGRPAAAVVIAVGPTLGAGARGDRRHRAHGRLRGRGAAVPDRRHRPAGSRRHRAGRAVPGRDERRARSRSSGRAGCTASACATPSCAATARATSTAGARAGRRRHRPLAAGVPRRGAGLEVERVDARACSS